MELRNALERLESNLAEDYPGEFLDIEALRTVVDYLRNQLYADDEEIVQALIEDCAG